MPLAKYASSFGPIELENMTAAFEAAWKQLSTSTGINLRTPSQIHLVRSRLAECIVVWAEIGLASDAEGLTHAALTAMSQDEPQ